MERILIEKDLVIVGGGVPGVAHAILSARLGLSVALVQNRGYLGGNSGAEIGVCVCGATGTQEFNYFARETGVIEELILENLHRNPDGNRYIWDGVLMDAVLAESNIELFLNTNVDGADVENGKITRVYGSQNTTGKTFIFSAPLFADDTGDGNLGYLAGAEYRYGREAKSEFGERLAPDVADNHVLSSTLMFCAKNVGHPVAYHAPEFALDLTKTDVLKHRIIPQEGFEKSMWFYEIDGDLDQNAEAETILLHQRALVYGIWDYIKNSGNYNAENYDLEYVSPIMGKRESRRLMGDYILTENDIAGQTEFHDVVGHGGWSIDLHAIRGFYATEPVNKHVYLKGVYQIPYRCGYSKNIDNLFIEGRCMSTSHVAFGSTRLIATLTTIAQANAAASYLCKKFNTSPRGVYEYHLEELQQLLLRHDQYLIGKPYTEKEDLAKRGTVTVSSVKKLAIEKQDGIKALDEDLAISLPVKKKMESVQLLLEASEATELSFEAFAPDKPGNYWPAKRLAQGTVSVPKTEGFTWVTVPLNVRVENPCNLFFVVKKNDKISWACSKTELPGVICSHAYHFSNECYLSINTLDRKEDWWGRLGYSLCFRAGTDEGVYAGENLLNGYTRPYMGANIWQAAGVENEFVKIKLPEKQTLSAMMLIFDSELDKAYGTTTPNPTSIIPNLVRDYKVSYRNDGGEWVCVAEICGNHQRVNRLDLNSIETDEIRVEFLATNGGETFGVYALRLYE